MRHGFTRGLIIGGIMGAAISMMVEPDMMRKRGRKRMMKNGRNFFRKSGDIIGDIVEIFR
jgi:gas vesicle protein